MAWTSPKTFTPSSVLPAVDLNVYLRDNMAVTEASLASNPGSHFVGTGLSAIAERIPTGDIVLTAQGYTATSYGDPATVGPTVSVTTGSSALVALHSAAAPTSAGVRGWISYAVSGATTIAASDDRSIAWTVVAQESKGATFLQTGLTPGVNVFTAKFKSATSGTSTVFSNRRIAVIPF